MAAAGRRRGRRNNGLDATDWRAVADLDPRVSEDVLALLAARGVAAYVQPAMDVDPVTRSARVPDRPTDRLYVDRKQAEAAREALRRLLGSGPGPDTGPAAPVPPAGPEPAAGTTAPTRGDPPEPPRAAGAGPVSGPDVDATFAGIVAGFDRQVDPTAASWPAAENLPGHPAGTGSGPATEDLPGHPAGTGSGPAGAAAEPPRRWAGPVDGRWLTESSLLDGLDAFGAGLPDVEPPERFVPPPPPPLPRLSRQSVLGALAVVAGLVLLLGGADLPLDRTTTLLLGFATILGGAVALILRLRPGTDPEEDTRPDDGAQV